MDLFYIIPAIFILGVCTQFPPGLEPPPPPFEGTLPPLWVAPLSVANLKNYPPLSF